MRYLALALAALTLISCNRDPNYLKQQYLQSGNKYFDKGKYKEASIMYRKAIEKDRKWGPGYYHLSLVSLKQGQIINSVPSLRRAIELLPPDSADANDANLKLAEILVLGSQSVEKNEALLAEATQIRDGLLKRHADSWEAHKISGDLDMIDAARLFRARDSVEAKKMIGQAVTEYRQALAKKPGEQPISLALARTLVIAGEADEAESMFKNLIQRDKNNLQAYGELFRLYSAQRKTSEAEAILKSAIQAAPKDSQLRLTLAAFYYAQNRRPELVALLNQMKGDLASFPQAYMIAGDFYLRVGNPDEAIRQYEEGIQKDKAKKNDYRNLEIQVFMRQGKVQQAAAKNEEILKDDPKDNSAQALKATLLLDKGEVNKALDELQAVVTAKPNNFMARFNLGRAHFAKAEYDQARQEFSKAIEIRPDYLPARQARTQVSLMRGENQAALQDAEEILKYYPNNVQGIVMKAAALQRLGKMSDARALLEGVLAKNPKQPETLLEIGVLDLSEKRAKDAEEVFRQAWELNPSNLRGLLGEAEAIFQQGQRDRALKIIADEAKKNPNRIDIQRELGNMQTRTGQYDAAIATFNDALPKVQDNRQKSDLYFKIGDAYARKGDLQKSLDAQLQAHDRDPSNGGISTNIAMLYDAQHKSAEAHKFYDLALKTDPNNAVALNNLAYLITETNGDLDQALQYATRAKQKVPNFPEVTDTLGWIYLKKHLTDNALETFKGLVVASPQKSTFHYHYAMALAQKGDKETARKECEAALAQKPNKDEESHIRQLLTTVS